MWGQGQRSGVGEMVTRADYESRSRSADVYEVVFVEKHKTDAIFGPATITLDKSRAKYLAALYAFTGMFAPPGSAALFPRTFAARNEPKGLDITKVAQLFGRDRRYSANLVRKTNESLAFEGERSRHIDPEQKQAITRLHLHLEGTAHTKYLSQTGAMKAIYANRLLEKIHDKAKTGELFHVNTEQDENQLAAKAEEKTEPSKATSSKASVEDCLQMKPFRQLLFNTTNPSADACKDFLDQMGEDSFWNKSGKGWEGVYNKVRTLKRQREKGTLDPLLEPLFNTKQQKSELYTPSSSPSSSSDSLS